MVAVEVPARTTWNWVPDETGIGKAVVDESQTAFEFVQSLAAELSRGRVDLPTCPDVANACNTRSTARN